MKPTLRVRQRGELRFAHPRDQFGRRPTPRPSLGLIEPGDQVEQRGLARAARPHQAQELAGRHVEREAFEHVDPFAPALKILMNVSHSNNRVAQGVTSFLGRSSVASAAAGFKNATTAPISGFRYTPSSSAGTVNLTRTGTAPLRGRRSA